MIMRSQTIGHFPQVRFLNGRRWLFNPILKKRFANLPEERVRLQYVDFLLHQTNISRTRIGFETPVRAESATNTLRADLVLYNREMKPHMLIECKSGRIKLNEKTAEQAARYNQTLQAKFVMITNGREDFWYENEKSTVIPLQKNPIETVNVSADAASIPGYWIDRGFTDASLPKKYSGAASRFLKSIFTISPNETHSYLTLPTDIAPISLDHYYRIYSVDSAQTLAISMVSAPNDQTVLSVIMNRNRKNQGVLWVPLRDLLSDTSIKATLVSPANTRNISLPDDFSSLIDQLSDADFKKFINHLINFFD